MPNDEKQKSAVQILLPGGLHRSPHWGPNSLQLVAWCSEIFTEVDGHQHPGAIKIFHTALQGVRKIAASPFPC